MENNELNKAFYISDLLQKSTIGQELSSIEKLDLNQWLNESEKNRAMFENLADNKLLAGDLTRYQQTNTDAQLTLFYNTISKQKRQNVIKLWIQIAATLFIISTFVIYFLKRSDNKTVQQAQVLTEDVRPGKQAATLTLASGRKVFLSDAIDGKIAEESGVRITKDKNGLITYEITGNQSEPNGTNTLSTSRGETYQVILPDKSKVWLNAASSISYSTSLRERDGERRVMLSGEAYFAVAKDKSRPFIVKTNSQEVRVLGTQFNINSYNNQSTVKTTLIEGSVIVKPTIAPNIKAKKLIPGQQAELNKSSLLVNKADIESVVAWKNALFTFNEASVPEVMQQISRWYNIDVEYKGVIPDEKISGGISRQSDLRAVLKMLELINIKYQLEKSASGKKIIINPQ